MASLSLKPMLGRLTFSAAGLKMPPEYDTAPQPVRDHYYSSLKTEQKVAVPKHFPPLYKTHPHHPPVATHQNMCDTLSEHYKRMLEILCDATKFGHGMWTREVQLPPMPITAILAQAPAGHFKATTNIDDWMKRAPNYASLTKIQKKYFDAGSKGFRMAFNSWFHTVTIVNPNAFPSFAAGPTGALPPVQWVPPKLIACVSPNLAAVILPKIMHTLMNEAFKEECKKDGSSTKLSEGDDTFFKSYATVVSLGMLDWMSKQMVSGVIGTGSVTGFPSGPGVGVTMLAFPFV